MSAPHRCGSVALVGAPNAGKSTLLNQILGGKLAITSPKPQTTRHRIQGVYTAAGVQILLVDTPGIHAPHTEMNRKMVARATAELDEVDVVCWVADLSTFGHRRKRQLPLLEGAEADVVNLLQKTATPVVFAANKVDRVRPEIALPVLEEIQRVLGPQASVPLSALHNDGVDRLLTELTTRLPEGPPHFDEDDWAGVTERFMVEEIVREKVFHLASKEVPYATTVVVRSFDEEHREAQGRVTIFADIVVERASQKGILIGKGGQMIKKIGTAARTELNRLLDCQVHLELFVRVEREWSRSAKGLQRVGFDDPIG